MNLSFQKAMNRIFIFLVLLISCSQKESQPAKSETASLPQDLPPGALVEEYGDGSGVSRVVVKDNAGAIQQEGILKNGKREGNWIEYYSVGFIKTITPYVNDLKEGIFVEMGANNQLAKKIGYHHNLKHGEYREYLYATLKEERYYQNDKIEGTVKVYYDIGKLMEEGNYKNGIRDGVSKWYDQEGNVTIEYEYKEGELIKK